MRELVKEPRHGEAESPLSEYALLIVLISLITIVAFAAL